ncbi:hypothetical protein HPB48_018904 [Haemaphysalis longicornis]|uniref:Uncharacterized protein n=1 Tax=Haemaphysalis longicornis TaxID=44386 RepID=A0A9J6G269_HAELO|nr:hypothetical protein HPB48_018904 [Haemaphysalis longicornis]
MRKQNAIISKTAGSELECQLALDLEKLHICKQQVDHTHFKWSQALLMVRQACSQFSRALKKWKDLEAVPQRHVVAPWNEPPRKLHTTFLNGIANRLYRRFFFLLS